MRARCALVIVCLLILAGAFAPARAAAPVSCGMTITTDTKLDADLTCSDTALYIGADGVTLDLKGHTITGVDGEVGIANYGYDSVTIKNGTVQGFYYNVVLSNVSRNVLTRLRTVGGTYSILIGGARSSRLAGNRVIDSEGSGIFIGSGADNIIEFNYFTGNGVGMWLFGGEDNLIRGNLAEKNDYGYYIGYGGTFRNTFSMNVARANQYTALWVPADENLIDRNLFYANGGNGIEVYGKNNTIRRNVSKSNASYDIYNHYTTSGNRYLHNRCDTSSGPPVDCGTTPVSARYSLESGPIPRLPSPPER